MIKQEGSEYKWAVYMDDAYVTSTETKQQALEVVRMMRAAEKEQEEGWRRRYQEIINSLN